MIAFRDYVEAYDGTDNTARTSSVACIALYTAGNATGSWVLWKIKTRNRIRRTNVKKLVMNELVINAMNAVAADDDRETVRNNMAEIAQLQSNKISEEAMCSTKTPEEYLVESQSMEAKDESPKEVTDDE